MDVSHPQSPAQPRLIRLFVAGDSPLSRLALGNLGALLAEWEKTPPQLQVVDIFQDYCAAQDERVLVTPTLIIGIAGHKMHIVGTLKDTSLVRQALGMVGHG